MYVWDRRKSIGKNEPLFDNIYITNRICWPLLTKERTFQTWQYVTNRIISENIGGEGR